MAKVRCNRWWSVCLQVPNAIEEVLEEEAALEAAKENAKKVHQKQEDACSGKICTANEHCCEGQVCVDTDESESGFSITKLAHFRICKHLVNSVSTI